MYIILVLTAISLLVLRSIGRSESQEQMIPKKLSLRLQALWDDAQKSMRENKFIRAEKSANNSQA